MWIEATLFDESFMQSVLATDVFEYGRSGRAQTRDAALGAVRRAIDVVLPLRELRIRNRDGKTARVAYSSESDVAGRHVRARRSSMRSKTPQGWRLRFHQGAPLAP
ncbi:MAG: DUF4440 domain-containing protein [Steroidobacteraceae bacterium]|jgi:hypothetical protein